LEPIDYRTIQRILVHGANNAKKIEVLRITARHIPP
jgi:hypothetical protein